MLVNAKIESSRKFEYQGKKFVKLQGFLSGLGLFEQTVKEEIVPDFLEGKKCIIDFDIGIAGFKPYLKVREISLDSGIEN